MAIHIRLILFAFCSFLASCTTTEYFGKTYPPTQRVDVFFSTHDIRRNYEVMGQIRAEADEFVSLQAMQQQLMNEAMQKGADAILIEHVGKTETGVTTVAQKTKEKKKSGDSSSTMVSTTQIETNRLVLAKLLKYR
jgi:methionine synthase I (cobalamin-dependent)